MGRKLKRVPLDFQWPSGKVWEGYINPHRGQSCPHCDRGFNKATQAFHDEWYHFHEADWAQNPYRSTARYNKLAWCHNLTQEDVDVLVQEECLYDFTHQFIKGEGWKPKVPAYHPTAAEVNDWSLQGLGLSSSHAYVCVKARAEKAGVYGLCEHCDGETIIYSSEELREKHDNWTETEPPTGEGFQLWENTSEGSPKSPVFKTLRELCAWCEKNATTFADEKTSKENWHKMLEEDNVYFEDTERGMIFI